ncbi:MAG TPA: Stk1 family PASTA domain-containing Ser/Thr kinase [Galbitalea sp.]|nr:Stk1 family PASTA domain-containing Ser/Thr kinase [Galbitalea sp.]
MTDSVNQRVRLLAGRYEIGALIGRGGMADVRVGTDARLGRRVAIKLLKPALAKDPAFRTRFRREAQDAAKMAHPTIVRIFDAGEETVVDPSGNEAQIPFIVMEYVDGRLLKDIIAEGPLPEHEAVRIAGQILTALEYSHRAGVVHRDIKPGNIMIATNGQVKVMDFGIARAVSESSATITETSAIVGTAQYFSPEQARGESVDARTDLYSTGVVLFEMLTGRAPFRGENPVAVAYQHVNQVPAPPSSLNRAVSPSVDAVVEHALSKDRFARFQSASEFREQLDGAGSGAPPVVRQVVPANDFNATLFGVNPTMTANSDAALRQLTVDQDARGSRTQQRPPVAWIWAGIALLLVIVIAVVVWTITLPKDTGIDKGLSVRVPDLKGQSYDGASTALKKLGLDPVEQQVASSTIAPGAVISTTPGSGSSVAPHTSVTVTVSSGPAALTVPDVTGLSVDAATAKLKQVGLKVGTTTAEDSQTVAAGMIVETNPAAGSSAKSGDSINLLTSTGKVNIPSVVGQSGSAAGAALTALHITYDVIPNPGCSGATVSAQSLVGEQPQNSSMTITVCTG